MATTQGKALARLCNDTSESIAFRSKFLDASMVLCFSLSQIFYLCNFQSQQALKNMQRSFSIHKYLNLLGAMIHRDLKQQPCHSLEPKVP